MTHGRIALSLIALTFAVTASAKNPPKLTGPTPAFSPGTPKIDIEPAIYNGPPRSIPYGPMRSGVTLPPVALRAARRRSVASSSKSILRLPVAPENVPTSANALYTVSPAGGSASADVEPALVTTRVGGTTDYTLEAYSAFIGPGYHVQVESSSNLTSNTSTFTTPYEPPVGSYTDSGDPYLASNPYGTGIRPGAAYLSYLSFNRDSSGNAINPSQVTIWASDDGGNTWPSASTVANAPSGTAYLLDKPVMDVSWYSGTLGDLYIAWDEDFGNSQNDVVFRANTNGLYDRCRPAGGGCVTSWGNPVHMNVNPDGSVLNEDEGDPQVVANPDNGNVYVFYLNFYGELRMRRLVNGASAFDWPVVVVSGINLIYGSNSDGILPNGLRAIVVPTVKYNSATHKIVATWHTRTAPEPTNETAIYLVTFDPDTISGPVTTNPQPIIDANGTQMQPAVDNDDAGNMLLTYFSTQNSAGSFYQPFSACVSPAGALTCSGAAFAGLMPNGFIGDYHDNFYWTFSDFLGGRWNTSWTSYATYTGYDPAVTGVQ